MGKKVKRTRRNKKKQQEQPKLSPLQQWIGVYEHLLICDKPECGVTKEYNLEDTGKIVLSFLIRSGLLGLEGMPKGVKWIAQDIDGTWHGFTDEPKRGDSRWFTNDESAKLFMSNWQNTLIPVHSSDEEE